MNEITIVESNSIVNQASTFSATLVEKFIKYLDCSPLTIKTYENRLKVFFEYLASNNITRPTREDILSFKDYLKDNYSPTTTKLTLVAVRLFFQFLDDELGVYKNIAKHIKSPKINNAPKSGYLTTNQLQNLIKSIDPTTIVGARDIAIITLMSCVGLRRIEVQRAKVCDLTTQNDTSVLYVLGKARDDKEIVVIPPQVEKTIRHYLSMRPNLKSDEPMFLSHSNRNQTLPLTTTSISRLLKSRFKAIGINAHGHMLRHSCATLGLLNNESLQSVSMALRHKTLQQTLTYSHNLDTITNRVSRVVANVVFGKENEDELLMAM